MSARSLVAFETLDSTEHGHGKGMEANLSALALPAVRSRLQIFVEEDKEGPDMVAHACNPSTLGG